MLSYVKISEWGEFSSLSKNRKQTKKQTQAQPTSAISPMMIGVVAAAAVLVVVGLIILGNQSRASEPFEVSQFPALGDANAPVTFIEFSDYGCSHCRDFALGTFSQLEADYINTGKVRYIVHPFNLGYPELALATEAAWCAQDQGDYFAYHHTLYENQGLVAYNQVALTDLAASIGLDQTAFAQCLSNHTHQADVEKARQAAANRGINSTPTFFINNQRVNGNQPYEVFQRLIEQELAISQ